MMKRKIQQGEIDHKANGTPNEIGDDIVFESSQGKPPKPCFGPLLPVEQEA